MNPRTLHRRRTINRTINQLRTGDARKRAAVFAAIAQELEEGPAPVAYRTIRGRVIEDPLYIPIRKIDPLTSRLVDDGYLRIVTEGEHGTGPRIWDLGPRLVSA